MKADRGASLKAWRTIRVRRAFAAARAAEAASKKALADYCVETGWKLAVFEGSTGSPRTGIIDAFAYRLGRSRARADVLEILLIQLKGGKAGVTADEIRRLKEAASNAEVKWLIAAFDGRALQMLPDDMLGKPKATRKSKRT